MTAQKSKKSMIKKIVLGIFLYLLIGVFVTVKFFEHRPIHMNAAVLIYLSPLVWPVLVVSMISEEIGNFKSGQEDIDYQKEEYEKNMADCPEGFEASCNRYFVGSKDSLQSRLKFSEEEAEEEMRRRLFEDKLPEDPEKRTLVAVMAHRQIRDKHRTDEPGELLEVLQPLFAETAPVSANYVAAYTLTDRLGYSLAETKRTKNPSRERLEGERKALAASISAYERYLDKVPVPYTDMGLALLYHAYADLLPPGAEKSRANERAARYYVDTALKGKSTTDVLCGIEGFLQIEKDWAQLEPFLAAVEKSLSGRELDSSGEPTECAGLPNRLTRLTMAQLRFSKAGGKYQSPVDTISESYWPLMDSPETRLAATYYLLPIVSHKSDFSGFRENSKGEGWRGVCYGAYTLEKDPRWIDLFYRLAEEKLPDYQRSLPFYRAERAFIDGRKDEAREMLYRYFLDEGAPNEAIAYSRGDGARADLNAKWGYSEEARDFKILAQKAEEDARIERNRRKRQQGSSQ